MLNVPLEEIEPGIRNLVEIVNKIPFVDTDQSCEGHIIRHYKGIPIKNARLEPPFLMLIVDGIIEIDFPNFKIKKFEHPLTKSLLKIFKQVANNSQYAKFKLHNLAIGKNPKPYYSFYGGQIGYFSVQEAKARKKEYDRAILNLEEEITKFVNLNFNN